jgi:hypothetical protein
MEGYKPMVDNTKDGFGSPTIPTCWCLPHHPVDPLLQLMVIIPIDLPMKILIGNAILPLYCLHSSQLLTRFQALKDPQDGLV